MGIKVLVLCERTESDSTGVTRLWHLFTWLVYIKWHYNKTEFLFWLDLFFILTRQTYSENIQTCGLWGRRFRSPISQGHPEWTLVWNIKACLWAVPLTARWLIGLKDLRLLLFLCSKNVVYAPHWSNEPTRLQFTETFSCLSYEILYAGLLQPSGLLACLLFVSFFCGSEINTDTSLHFIQLWGQEGHKTLLEGWILPADQSLVSPGGVWIKHLYQKTFHMCI